MGGAKGIRAIEEEKLLYVTKTHRRSWRCITVGALNEAGVQADQADRVSLLHLTERCDGNAECIIHGRKWLPCDLEVRSFGLKVSDLPSGH